MGGGFEKHACLVYSCKASVELNIRTWSRRSAGTGGVRASPPLLRGGEVSEKGAIARF